MGRTFTWAVRNGARPDHRNAPGSATPTPPVRKMNGGLAFRSGAIVQDRTVMHAQIAKFALGQIVRHREQAFRGVVVDVDAVYAGAPGEADPATESQPFYQVLAMG